MPFASASMACPAARASATEAGPKDSAINVMLRIDAASGSSPAARACASACRAAVAASAACPRIQRMWASRNPAHARPTSSPPASNTLRAVSRCASARRASNRPACTSASAVARSPNAWKRGSVDDSSSLAATHRFVRAAGRHERERAGEPQLEPLGVAVGQELCGALTQTAERADDHRAPRRRAPPARGAPPPAARARPTADRRCRARIGCGRRARGGSPRSRPAR